jgi:hypothetical protein
MKTLGKIIFCLLLLTPVEVYALDDGFYSTISLSIGSIGRERVDYKESDVVGQNTYNVVRENTMDNLTNDGYKRRVYNQYQRAALPPFSKIDIGYYWYNNTTEGVNVEAIRIPLSREIQSRGDATDILYDIGFEDGLTCTESICKGGKYVDFEGVGLLSSDMYKDPKKGIVIGSLTIKLPVEITKFEIEYLSEYTSKILIYVKNTTGQQLEDVWINYKGEVSKIVDLEGYQEVVLEVYKRCTLEENSINCGTVRIIDRNVKTHCIMYGSPWDSYQYQDSITVFNKIGGQWISGAQIQPTVESFCIQRIPYVYTTEEMVAYIEPQEEVTTEQYWQELLDIDVLPITSYTFDKFDRLLTLLKPSRIDTL